jgi:hypothetical protein
MNSYRLSAAVAAVAAVVAVGLAGCGGSTASKPPSAHPSASTTPAGTAPAAQPSATQSSGTQVITYDPWASSGTLASGITAASTKSGGDCWEASSTSSASNAFRCQADNIIYDPCFTDGSSGAGECAYPSTDNPDSVTIVTLTSALPAPQASTASPIPWLLVLANGLRCGPITGTGGPALDGKAQSYNCGTAGDPVVGVMYGNPDETSSTWTVSYAPLHASAMTQVDVTTAYE